MYTLLVADDEEIECCGITNVVRECFPQITVVGSVHNGAEMIKAAREYHPDIIIADINMPGMNGLEAAEVLRQEKINSRLIINTAYSYFEYAKKAILLKAVDYLLKPIEREMFCQTIDRVLKAIDQERSKDLDEMKDNKTFQKMLDVAGREVLSSVIMGNPNVEELNIWLENMGHTYWGGFFVAGKCIQDQVSEQQLKEICQLSEHKQKSEGTFLAKVFNGMVVWFFFPEEKIGKTNYREWITEYLEKISEEARRISGSEMHFGVSNWHYDFEEMHQAYQEAVTAVNSSPEQKIVAFQTVGQVRKLMQISNKNMEKLAEYVKEQDMKKCKNLLEEQLQLCREAEVTEQEKNVMFTLMLQDCSRKVCGYNIYSWNQIKAAVSKDPENLSTAVLYLLHNLDALKDSTNTRTGYVLKSLGYIEEHFTENISLDMAAEDMGISSFYLSRLLTQQLQISFVDLLTSARIDRAIELIRNQKIVVRNIGLKCGYQSAAYFYKAFKKNTGMTVGEMREFLSK